MGVNDFLCTYASVCIVILHVQSRYGLLVKQTVIKIPSKLHNKRTRDHPPIGGGWTTQKCLSMHLILTMTGLYCLYVETIFRILNLCTERMGVTHGLLSYI